MKNRRTFQGLPGFQGQPDAILFVNSNAARSRNRFQCIFRSLEITIKVLSKRAARAPNLRERCIERNSINSARGGARPERPWTGSPYCASSALWSHGCWEQSVWRHRTRSVVSFARDTLFFSRESYTRSHKEVIFFRLPSSDAFLPASFSIPDASTRRAINRTARRRSDMRPTRRLFVQSSNLLGVIITSRSINFPQTSTSPLYEYQYPVYNGDDVYVVRMSQLELWHFVAVPMRELRVDPVAKPSLYPRLCSTPWTLQRHLPLCNAVNTHARSCSDTPFLLSILSETLLYSSHLAIPLADRYIDRLVRVWICFFLFFSRNATKSTTESRGHRTSSLHLAIGIQWYCEDTSR